MLKGLRTVVYKVDDLEKAKEFYSALLGFGPYFDEPFYVGYNVGGYELGLDPDTDGATRGNFATAFWGVDDITIAVEKLKGTGVEISSDIEDVGSGIKVASVVDPFGNQVGLIENPHFKLAD